MLTAIALQGVLALLAIVPLLVVAVAALGMLYLARIAPRGSGARVGWAIAGAATGAGAIVAAVATLQFAQGPSLAPYAAGSGGVELRNRAHSFRITFPARPRRVRVDAGKALPRVNAAGYRARVGGTEFLFAQYVYPEQVEGGRELLDAFARRVADEREGEVDEVARLELRGYDALDYEVETSDGYIVGRAVVVGDQLLVAQATGNGRPADAARRFVRSLRLLVPAAAPGADDGDGGGVGDPGDDDGGGGGSVGDSGDDDGGGPGDGDDGGNGPGGGGGATCFGCITVTQVYFKFAAPPNWGAPGMPSGYDENCLPRNTSIAGSPNPIIGPNLSGAARSFPVSVIIRGGVGENCPTSYAIGKVEVGTGPQGAGIGSASGALYVASTNPRVPIVFAAGATRTVTVTVRSPDGQYYRGPLTIDVLFD